MYIIKIIPEDEVKEIEFLTIWPLKAFRKKNTKIKPSFLSFAAEIPASLATTGYPGGGEGEDTTLYAPHPHPPAPPFHIAPQASSLLIFHK